MSNMTLGGYDSIRARHFSYYETIAGGAGAAPGHPGAAGLHTHMTNTLNTPIEALEAYYPMRVTEYRVRRGSGGRGAAAGGDGLIRELECLVPATLSLLTDRRITQPWGLAGGRSRQSRRELPGARRAANQAARQGQRASGGGRAGANRNAGRGRMGPRGARPHPPPLMLARPERGADHTTQRSSRGGGRARARPPPRLLLRHAVHANRRDTRAVGK